MTRIKSVLVIDDDEVSNFLCLKTIERTNFASNVKTVMSGQEGLEYLSKFKDETGLPELILLDINMPGMNGWDFLEAYKELLSSTDKVPVLLMLSSSVYENDVRKACNHELVNEYITKPLTEEKLEEIYRKFFAVKK